MSHPEYALRTNAATHMVQHLASGRFLGGFGTNYWRSWVFPLYTPGGQTVVQEFPFDHPFHNGLFAGQNPVRLGDREANFWALPVRRSADDHIMVRIGRMDPQGPVQAECTTTGARLHLNSIWRDEQGQALLDEERSATFAALPTATLCELSSRKTASYGQVEFGRTKFGSLGARVEPRLLPALGGQVIGCQEGQLRRGLADEVANGRECDAVAYETALPGGGVFGLCLIIHANSAAPGRCGPWFIRDYGMAMFNATQQAPVIVPEGQTWTAALRAVAYEGPLDADRLETWRHLEL